MRFLTDDDYDAQIRKELRTILDDSQTSHKLHKAEDMALSQMKAYLSRRYDVDKIFTPGENRNPYIVMLLIDITLYHIWSKERGQIPQTRNDRYQDALDWLKSTGNGEGLSDLPSKPNDSNSGNFFITSKYPPNDHKY